MLFLCLFIICRGILLIKECVRIGQSTTARTIKDSVISITMCLDISLPSALLLSVLPWIYLLSIFSYYIGLLLKYQTGVVPIFKTFFNHKSDAANIHISVTSDFLCWELFCMNDWNRYVIPQRMMITSVIDTFFYYQKKRRLRFSQSHRFINAWK